MNYLAHLHLGGPGREDRLGSLYGDFVKGSPDAWPAGIAAGIRLHRRIDVYTDEHPQVAQAKARLPATRRRVSGLLVDVFFDHCLARLWHDYAEQSLPSFVADCYRTLLDEPELPPRLARIAPVMARQDWLGSYRDFAVLERVVEGMARRLSRPELLAGAFAELEAAYDGLLDDFLRFYPQLQAFAAAERAAARLNG
ncbi:ACP phosphodiesterase [Pseudomonas oryzihabitans]|uniref:Acyl carrier protein phosphodiesterase n=1 Tax=Pseudomonas oryzihabitans TaxID=47885 RepID=A0AAJ2BG81_9PSED|nr:ACP phosphodiesterase [Pseudomonas psychrotolerans]MDR6233688.1 acyl carrier protein phosphodiesterase [Pseudomonas psychrotolerans]MDR6357248.1 acyl carrier protein phosphodiesterase [Pseudomonas psychrotolerans]